jgi:CBS domain-containing protein
MRVGEVMTQGVETTTAETTLQAAALRMREAGVGMLPILEGRRPIGVITDRDITVRATANGLDPTKSHVRDVMTSQVFCCFEDESIEEAARLMQEHTVRRILVLDRDKRMVGIITLDDLSSLSREERAGPVLE